MTHSVRHPRLRASRAPWLLAFALGAALVLSGCGEGGSAGGEIAPVVTQPSSEGPEVASDRVDADIAVQPTRAARAAGNRYDQLVRAYAPVSVRINFLVTAETLRADAVESGAAEAVEVERFGSVRLEIERMRPVLRRARQAVASVAVNGPDQQHVRDLMLAAIDARMRALGEHEVALGALANEEAPDSQVDALVDAWQASWDESVRYARDATTAMQDARARLGLSPALEESIR